MARGKKKIIDIKLIIGILFLLVLLVGASYAYFAVEVNSTDYNKTIVTGSTEGVAIASIQNPTTKLNLNVDGAAMSQNTLGTIYADDEDNYVKTKSEGFHDIGVITLTNAKKDDNIYRCTANVTITVDNGANSILSYLQPDDLKIFIRWGTNHKIIDLSTIKNTGEITIPISLDIVGNNSKSIETYIELTNKESDQSYISGKEINIDIDTTNLKCELTGERAVYLTGTNWNAGIGYKMGHITDVKNIYFVNYIDTTNAVEDPIDLTNKGTSKNQSPAGSIMGWLEEIPKETDEEQQYYDLYIGSNDRIYGTNMHYFYLLMNNLTSVSYDNFYTDVLTTFSESFYTWADIHPESNFLEYDVSTWDVVNVGNLSAFHGMSSLTELDVSNFNTKNATNMNSMFSGAKLITVLDVSNFNTMKVTNMSGMFKNMTSLLELDVSGFYTGKVTTMSEMFRNLALLQDINISKFDTSKVTTMEGMFLGMKSIQKLDLSSFDTSNVTDMSQMFYSVSQIKNLDLSNFDTRKVTDTNEMFRGMSSLEYLDLRNAEFSQVESYKNMFYQVNANVIIIVKNETNRKWFEDNRSALGLNKSAQILLPNEMEEL